MVTWYVIPFATKKNMYQSDSEMIWYFIWWLCNKKNIYDMVDWGYEIPFLVFKGERVEYFL